MVCIYCGSKTQVSNSRLQKQANNIWRRRACIICGGTFTTHESADLGSGFVVKTSLSDVEPFSRDKLFISVYESCKHRKTALTDAGALAQTIINNLVPAAQNGTLEPSTIATITYETLSRFDKTASAVYAAYHPLIKS